MNSKIKKAEGYLYDGWSEPEQEKEDWSEW